MSAYGNCDSNIHVNLAQICAIIFDTKRSLHHMRRSDGIRLTLPPFRVPTTHFHSLKKAEADQFDTCIYFFDMPFDPRGFPYLHSPLFHFDNQTHKAKDFFATLHRLRSLPALV